MIPVLPGYYYERLAGHTVSPPRQIAFITGGGWDTMSTSQWAVDVTVCDGDDGTQARVRLSDGAGNSFTGIGLVRGDMYGRDVPQIACDLAVARALVDVTEELLGAVAADVHAAVLAS